MIKYINIDNYVSGVSVYDVADMLDELVMFNIWIKNLNDDFSYCGFYDKDNNCFETEDGVLLEDFLKRLDDDFYMLHGETYNDDMFRVQRIIK